MIPLREAVASVKNKSLSYKKASEKYNVPVATICERVKHANSELL